MKYCTADTKATPASIHSVAIDFLVDMDFASPQRCETFTQSRIHWEPGSLGFKAAGGLS
jgi:hypothetical protein